MTGGTLTVEGEGDRGHTHCSGGRVTGGTLTVAGGGRAALPAGLAFPFLSLLLSALPFPAGRGKAG